MLSGGERGRLTLARAFARPSNLLVLDEPTNDLDLETLDVLQERLAEYRGTVLLVSHDRDFLDRVVTSVVAPERGGRWIEYAGSYTDMMAQRGPGVEATSPGAGSRDPGVAKPPLGTRPETDARPTINRIQRRMTFKDRHSLETLPKRIAALQDEVARWNAILADSGLYARDPARFVRVTEELTRSQAELGAAEDEWLTLEMLREELEA